MPELKRLKNRMQAGQLLAQRLARYSKRSDVIVLALPRGGVPVGFTVAKALFAPLDILIVRKLGVPGDEELAMGAIASGGRCVLQADVLRMLAIPKQVVEAVVQRETREIRRREKLYRAGRPALDVRGLVVILVDDGMATGSTMLAAVDILRESHPARIVVAVPVASPDTGAALHSRVDEVVCLLTPEPLHAVGRWYEDFGQTSDDEVTLLLDEATRSHARFRAAPGADQAGAGGSRDERGS